MASEDTSAIVFPAVSVSYENALFEDPTDGEDAVTVAVEVETVCPSSLVMYDLTTDLARDLTTDLTRDSKKCTVSGLFPSSGLFPLNGLPPTGWTS